MNFDAFQHSGFQPSGFQEVAVASVLQAPDGVWFGVPRPPLAELLADQAARLDREDAERAAAIAGLAAHLRNPWAEEERAWGLDDERLLGLVA